MVDVVGQTSCYSCARRKETEVVELVGQASRYSRVRRGKVKDDQLGMGSMVRVVE